jgi:general nucleoside transport system permease protein
MASPDLPTAEQDETQPVPAEPTGPPVARALRQLDTTLARLVAPKALRGRGALRTIGAIAATVGLFALLIAILGASPGTAFDAMYTGSVGNFFNLGQTIMIASLLVCTGLGAAIPFRAHLWNVGGEGQMWFGAFCTMGAAFGLPASTPRALFIIVCVLAGMAGGAFWGFIPGALKGTINANEVITSLMMTFIAIELGNWAIDGIWPQGATNQTMNVPNNTLLPNIWPNTLVTLGCALAVCAAMIAWLLMARTRLGFEIRAVGLNPNAAQMSGMSTTRVAIASFTLGGTFAGLAGAIFILGINGALPAGFNGSNFGYLGIAVALVARLSPAWIVPSGFLFAALLEGSNGLQAQTGLSITVGQILMAVFVVLLLAFRLIRFTYPEAVR